MTDKTIKIDYVTQIDTFVINMYNALKEATNLTNEEIVDKMTFDLESNALLLTEAYIRKTLNIPRSEEFSEDFARMLRDE